MLLASSWDPSRVGIGSGSAGSWARCSGRRRVFPFLTPHRNGFAVFWRIESFNPERNQFHKSQTFQMSSNSNCETLYDGVILQPYIVIIMDTFLFMFLKLVSETLIIPFVRAKFCNKKKSLTDTENGTTEITDISTPISQEQTDINKKQELRNIIFTIKSPVQDKHASLTFLYFQVFSSFISCVLAFFQIDKNQSRWIQYTNLYGLLLNSSLVTTSVSLLLKYYEISLEDKRGNSEERRKAWKWYLLSLLPLVPIVITHIIPGVIVYIWVALIVAAALGIVWGIWICCSCCKSEIEFINNSFSGFMFEIIARLFFVFFFQTLFNYMAIFYSFQVPISSSQYIGVIVEEYNLRLETYCYFHRGISDVKSAIVVFSWL